MTEHRNILVTGGAGFIGSHCCKALARRGYAPVVIDNLSRGHADAVKWGPLVRADLRDVGAVREAITDFKIDAVIHFAALAYVGESVSDPEAYYDNNIGGMSGLLTAMRETGVSKMVFSSSCATYGVPAELPIREGMAQRPINPYGRTKLICEWMLEDAERAHGLCSVSLRYFNAAGADPEGELSERHAPETHIIPLALMAASGQADALNIFGTDYPTPDGTCIRDYIHVVDLVDAHLLALAHLDAGKPSDKLNLGTGRGTSVRQVVDAVARVTGRDVPVIEAPRRAGDPAELTADPTRARDVLGFTARYTDLDDMVAQAAPWFGHQAEAGANDVARSA